MDTSKTSFLPTVAKLSFLAWLTVPSSSLLSSSQVNISPRPSFLPNLELSRGISEVDKLTAKRLSRRRRAQSSTVDKIELDDVRAANTGDGLEYYYDTREDRSSDDPFHIILLGSTFQKDGMSIDCAASSCNDVLRIPLNEAEELSMFAKYQGFSCLGTWTRDECVSFGNKLQSRDLDCRVVPFCEGGERNWQLNDGEDTHLRSEADIIYYQG